MTDNNFQRVVSRYQIVERIGTGGMARVYLATDTNLERPVAIKILHDHLADDDIFRQRFEREAKFLASFNHPNVIQIYDYAARPGPDGYLCYMVMTYLPGPTLKDIIDQNTEKDTLMSQERVQSIIENIAAALDYAHAQSMIHRDVKPANILFDERDRAVLTDFGIARLAQSSRLTQENMAVGTPAYMAPEQAGGEDVDARVDIYALGVILYELLAGRPPFGDDGSISILLKHLNDPVPILSELPHIENPALDAIVVRALAKNPEDRYETAGDMAKDLARAMRGEAVPLPEITSPPDEKKKRSPRRGPSILAVGIAVVSLTVAAAFLLTRSELIAPAVPTISPPEAPPEEATLDPADFRRFGGVDSMVGSAPEENIGFVSTFDDDDPYISLWSTGSVDTVTREIVDDRYLFGNEQPSVAITNVIDDYQYNADLTIRMEARLETDSPRPTGYGIVFRFQNMQHYNVFAVDGAGRFSIWTRSDGIWQELRQAEESWTRSPAVSPIGQDNLLEVSLVGDVIRGYVNGEQVTEVTDSTFDGGQIGIYLGTPSDIEDGALISMNRYEVVIDTVTDSMTDPITD